MKTQERKGRDIVIVSDKFKAFCEINESQQIITVSEAIYIMEMKQHHRIRFISGQGLSRASEEKLLNYASRCNALPCFEIWLENSSQVRASKQYSHKHLVRNQLISMPRELSENIFGCELLIDEKNELMTDHETGTHVQGMLIIEAARQMFISVSESFYCGHSAPKNGYFVINHMNFEFISFAFPIPISVEMSVNKIERKNKQKTKMGTTIKFIQNGSVVTLCEIEFSVIGEKIFQRMEDKLARASANKVFSSKVLTVGVRAEEFVENIQA